MAKETEEKSKRKKFSVKILGQDDSKRPVEYMLRITHRSGYQWDWRCTYEDFKDLHKKLTRVFGGDNLPPFPVRFGRDDTVFQSVSLNVLPFRSDEVKNMQKYLDGVTDREDLSRTRCFQATCGVSAPDAVSRLRVTGWQPSADDLQMGMTALLEMGFERRTVGSRGIVEAFDVTLSYIIMTPGIQTHELALAYGQKVPVSSKGLTNVALMHLKSGTAIEFGVSTSNCTGLSTAVTIRAIVPVAECSRPVAGARVPKIARNLAEIPYEDKRGLPLDPPEKDDLSGKQKRMQYKKVSQVTMCTVVYSDEENEENEDEKTSEKKEENEDEKISEKTSEKNK